MTSEEKALYHLAPRQMMQKWHIEGTLCRNMKLFDKENTYFPKNLFTIIKKISNRYTFKYVGMFLMQMFYAEDENGIIQLDEFKKLLSIKTHKTFLKHMQFVLDTGLISIEEQTKEYIKFNYKKLIDTCIND